MVYNENGELLDENQTLIGPVDDVSISLEYRLFFLERYYSSLCILYGDSGILSFNL